MVPQCMPLAHIPPLGSSSGGTSSGSGYGGGGNSPTGPKPGGSKPVIERPDRGGLLVEALQIQLKTQENISLLKIQVPIIHN